VVVHTAKAGLVVVVAKANKVETENKLKDKNLITLTSW
jgi:hypothetical protein